MTNPNVFGIIDQMVMRLEDEGVPFDEIIDHLAEYVAISDDLEAQHYATL